jgi:uncharacterized membrane protein YfcA
VIENPWFYAVAVPAVLLMGISKSGFGAGFGALATPLMALAVPVPQAAAIMLPLLSATDAFGFAALFRQRDRGLVRLLLPAGLLGTAIGTLLFGWLSAKAVAGLTGGITLAFLAIRMFFPPRADAPPPSRAMGFAMGTVSGFTSFIAHAGGPPVGFYVMPLKLPPLVFAATMSVFFTAVNLAKYLPYAFLGLFDGRSLATSLALMPLTPLGVWVGVRFARRVSPTLFYRLFLVGMFCTGSKLLWDGLH